MNDSRSLENKLVKIIAAMAFLVFAYFVIQIFANIYSGKLTQNFSATARAMDDDFRAQIASQTNAYEAAKLGMTFLRTQKDELALAAFEKATTLDSGYRDAWVWRGYTELKTNQPQEALASLKKAEEIDPINARTYQLLAIAYSQTGDVDAAKKAEEKFQYLTKGSD